MEAGAIARIEQVENIILLFLRGNRVILDRDLAQIYGVTTGNLNKAVKRNMDRFPEDFYVPIDTGRVSISKIPLWNLRIRPILILLLRLRLTP